jgi:hypothetical protein
MQDDPTQYPQPVPPQLPTKRRPSAISVILGTAVILLLLSIISWFYWPQVQVVARNLEPSCTIGFGGTSATLTIQGWSASDDCNKTINGEPNFVIVNPQANKQQFYLSSNPTGDIQCEFDDQGRHIIVRDSGSIKLVGLALCDAITKQLSGVQ